MTLRAEHVGSLLRPPELLEIRAAYQEGRVTAREVADAEDAAILRALDLQREVGLDVFSDGEYRRSWFACNLPDAVSGLVPNPERVDFVWEGVGRELAVAETAQVGLGLTIAGGPIRQVRRLAGHEAAFLRDHSPGPYKVALTGTVQHARSWFRPGGGSSSSRCPWRTRSGEPRAAAAVDRVRETCGHATRVEQWHEWGSSSIHRPRRRPT
jgi:5-methyltetrahydropteroyltriglutamate--homocysteine methyltransferase